MIVNHCEPSYYRYNEEPRKDRTMSTKARTNVTTPAGSLQWPALVEPDTRFEANGVYKTDIIIQPGDAADKFEEMLDGIKKDYLAYLLRESGGKKVRIHPSSAWERDDAGNLVVKAKLAARVESKSKKVWTQRPALFDSKGQKLDTEGIRIGSGTTARLALEVNPYNIPASGAGVSLRLRGVQIIELREYAGKSAQDFGFGAVETGFVSETFDNFEEDREMVPPKDGKKVKAQDF